MPKARLTDATWKGIVARVLAGKSTAAAEARKYLQPRSTVQSRVDAVRAEEEASKSSPGRPAVVTSSSPPSSSSPSSVVVTPSENKTNAGGSSSPSPSSVPSDALAKAQAAAAGHELPTTTMTKEQAIAAAAEDDRKLVLETYCGGKKHLVDFVGTKMIGIPDEDPLLAKAGDVGPLTKMVLEVNAGLIAPLVRGKLVGWPAVAGAIALDGLFTFMAIRQVARVRGLVKPRKKRGAPEHEDQEEKQGGGGAPPPAAA